MIWRKIKEWRKLVGSFAVLKRGTRKGLTVMLIRS